jgi:hypothetical protein
MHWNNVRRLKSQVLGRFLISIKCQRHKVHNAIAHELVLGLAHFVCTILDINHSGAIGLDPLGCRAINWGHVAAQQVSDSRLIFAQIRSESASSNDLVIDRGFLLHRKHHGCAIGPDDKGQFIIRAQGLEGRLCDLIQRALISCSREPGIEESRLFGLVFLDLLLLILRIALIICCSRRDFIGCCCWRVLVALAFLVTTTTATAVAVDLGKKLQKIEQLVHNHFPKMSVLPLAVLLRNQCPFAPPRILFLQRRTRAEPFCSAKL